MKVKNGFWVQCNMSKGSCEDTANDGIFVMQMIDGWKYVKTFCDVHSRGVPWQHMIDGVPATGPQWLKGDLQIPAACAIRKVGWEGYPETRADWVALALDNVQFEGTNTWMTFLQIVGVV